MVMQNMLKALVVDDESTTRDVLVNYLPWSVLGITEVREADDGLSALQIAADFKPDLVLSDIRMPRMNGIELAESLQRRLPDCRFIFLSGYSDKEYLKSAIRLKAVSYVEKPISIEEITDAIKAAASECSQIKERQRINLPGLRQRLCLSLAENSPEFENLAMQIQISTFEHLVDGTYISAFIWIQQAKSAADKSTGQQKDDVDKVVSRVMVSVYERYLSARDGNENLIIHFKTGSQHSKDMFVSLMQKLRFEIKAACTDVREVLIGIGSEVTGIRNIYSSFQMSVVAQKRCFFTSGINVFNTDNSLPYTVDDHLFTDFSDDMKTGKKVEAVLIVERLRNDLQRHPNTKPEYAKSIFTQISLILIRFAEDRNLSIMKTGHISLLSDISIASVLDDITTRILTLINLILQEIDGDCGDIKIISKVTSYILDQYQCEHLSIHSIARRLYLTPNYLSQLFKNRTGKTIHQYITEVRIDQAKQYLKDGSIKLIQISKSVGYQDAKYFTKVFEKTTGMKPKEFREKQYSEKSAH